VSCRICGSARVTKAGTVEYYQGYTSAIYDCVDCLCRFTEHFNGIYEALHANPDSCYGPQLQMAQQTKQFFDARDLDGLKRELCASSKCRFIIESIDQYPKTSRILEVGCSRGHHTAYFILAGYDVVGSDVSESAIKSARADFGPNFFLAGSPAVAERGPYDVIYHMGTIGCVSDPVGLTRSLLELLKPGGRLFFNAPNAGGCWLRGQLWIDYAPPPDVVTLYQPGFWRRFFSDQAYVSEEVEKCPRDVSFVIGLRKLTRRWRPPRPAPMADGYARYKGGPSEVPSTSDKLWFVFERNAVRAMAKLGLLSLVPALPTPFGLFVTLTRR
jgi:SAM-dependent methyltransferase